MFMPNIELSIILRILIKFSVITSARATSFERALGERAAGAACGRGFGGVPRKPLGSGLSSTGTPQGGGGGPKKRHLVLYKLAGFCHTERTPLFPKFGLVMRGTFLQKVLFFAKKV